jgi:glycogen debranching enzyme
MSLGRIIGIGLCSCMACMGIDVARVDATDIVVSLDKTTRDWADLSMGPPSGEDDADQSRNPRAVVSYVPLYGKPHADAGAKGTTLPRLNDGKAPGNGDDPNNNTWFDTQGHSRILVDLGARLDIARINVYSWHSGALSPQRYALWASERESTADAELPDLPKAWKQLATVDTFPLGEGGKHGSSINPRKGTIGLYRYLIFDLPANRPDWSRSGFLSEIDVYAAGRKLEEVTGVKREAGVQKLQFASIQLTKPLLDETPFLLSGPKLYEYGAMDGTFPPVGRLDGDQGGVWCHPIKLLNGFEFEVVETNQRPWRLVGPSEFTHEFASAKFRFTRGGLRAIRQDFVPEEESTLVSLLTLHNETDQPRNLIVRFSGGVNIRPSYESRLPNGRDVVEYADGLVTAFDSEMAREWGLSFGADRLPDNHRIEGNKATLSYPVSLSARGEATLRFLIVGDSHAGADSARARFKDVVGQIPERLTQKQALYRDRILGGVRFDCSDKTVTDAFYCAKANVMMSVMDLRPGYPAPFLAAGFPIYTWLFGCDSLYSTAGVAAGGFDNAARGTLECLLHYATQKKQGAHEVASNGRLLGWDHIQETPQLVLACWKHYQWTGDLGFLKAAYPVCREIITHALATADQDRDGYLEGPGLMEQEGMGPERIDSVCQLYAAYESLGSMTEALGESGTEDYRRRATELKRNFNRDWWNPSERMWACSLRKDGTQTLDNFWAVAFPQQLGIADPDKATIALDRIEKEWVNDQWGFVHQWKPKITDEGVGVVHNNVLAQTAFEYGRPDLAWKLIKLSAKAPLEERMLGAFDETTPGGGDLIQLWSFGPFLGSVVEGLAGVRPQPDPHHLDLFPQLPRDLDWFKLEGCRVGKHIVNLEHRRTAKGITTTVAHSEGDAPLSGSFWLPADAVASVTIDGRKITPARRPMPLSSLEFPVQNYELAPGQTLIVDRPTL